MSEFPPLSRDRSFWGITATQFLGAFNDNVFKMLVLLICADYVQAQANAQTSPYFDPYQTTASLLFAFAFVMFSGFAGYLADRFSKTWIVVASKMAEIVVMLSGLTVFLIGIPGSSDFIWMLFGVLFFMGVQSAFFGPSKFGILPELFSDNDLPMVNGVVLATTFLAIIFGTALAGILKDALQGQLWLISMVCVGLAIAGTATARMIRRTRAADPTLRFSINNWFNEPAIWRIVVADRLLFKVLLAYSVFWFVGGVIALSVTLLGQVQLGLSATTTALFNASMGLGIGSGCVCAAKLSNHDVKFSLVKFGSIGLCAGTSAAAIWAVIPIALSTKVWLIGASLLVGGFFGGWVAIPLQVFIQAHPPAALKGRVIAVMNLMTWVGILLASVYYFLALALTGFQMPPSWILMSVGVVMLLCGILPQFRTSEHLRDERAGETG